MSRRGFTIIELLVVIAIIAMLAGLSASAFITARRNQRLAAAAGTIQGILRAARNTSVAAGTPSFVVIDPTTRQVWAQSFENAGEWSFESVEDDIEIHEGEMIDGRVGSGVSFRGSSGFVDCGTRPAYDLHAGVVVEAWIRHYMTTSVRPPAVERQRKKPRLTRSGGRSSSAPVSFVILEKSGAYGFELTDGGALIGTIGEHEVRTEDDVVAPDRWVFVSMRYDGARLSLIADGVERQVWRPRSTGRLGDRSGTDLPEEIPISTDSLTISSPTAPFPGDIDEVRLRGRVDTLQFEYPSFLRLVGWCKIIHFDRRGHLDPAFHDGKVRLVLAELTDGKLDKELNKKTERKWVEGAADFSLTFDEWLETLDPADAVNYDQAEEEKGIEKRSYKDAKKIVIEIDRLGVAK